jgi:hypothetical protein
MKDVSSIFRKPTLLAGFGSVSEVADFDSKKVFVSISEIPCHPEIQKNVAHILDFLSKNYSINRVFQVYSVGKFKSKGLSAKKPDELERMLNAGQITGAEYFSLLHKKENFLFGVDDEKLYVKALDLNGQITQYYSSMDLLMAKYRKKLDELKDRYFTQENQIFNKDLMNKDKNESGWFYKRLKQYVDVLNISLKDCKNLAYYIENLISNDSINYDLSGKEMREIIERLKQEISYRDYRRLLDSTENFNLTGMLHIYLNRISEIDPEIIADLPNLQKLLNHSDKNQKINRIDLLAEEKTIIREVFRRNVQNFAEKEVVFLVEFIDSLSDFLHISSRENYEFCNAYINNRFKKLWAKYTGDDILPEIEPYFNMVNEYYKNNLQRGECFVQNSKVLTFNSPKTPELPGYEDEYWDVATSALEDAREIYVFITGGFHSKYLAQEFKRSNNSYVAIIPNVTRSVNLSESYKILRDKIQQTAPKKFLW